MSEELEAKAAEEKAAEEAKTAADKLAAENPKSEEEIAEEAKLAEEQNAATAKAAEEHKEKSKIGRRMSVMEDKMNDFIDRASQALTQPQRKPETSDLDDGEYMTVGSFRKIMKEQANEMKEESDNKANQDKLYGRAYEKELANIGDKIDDEEMHLQVMKLVTDRAQGAKFNVRSSKDPAGAAQINYYEALRSLSGKSTGKIPKLKGDKNLPPAGSSTVTKIKTETGITITPEIQEYMNKTGMKEEEVKELLKT